MLTCPEVPGSNRHHRLALLTCRLLGVTHRRVCFSLSPRRCSVEESLNVKRWVQQKRRPLEDERSFPLQDRAAEVPPNTHSNFDPWGSTAWERGFILNRSLDSTSIGQIFAYY